MGCSGSKPAAAPAIGKEQITGAAETQVAVEPQPGADAEKQAAQAVPVLEEKSEVHNAEEASTGAAQTEEPPKAETPKAVEPKAEESKPEVQATEVEAEEPKAEKRGTEEPKVEEAKAEEPKAEEHKAEALQAVEPKVEDVKSEEHQFDDARTGLPTEQPILAESKVDIKVTGTDEPQGTCVCGLW